MMKWINLIILTLSLGLGAAMLHTLSLIWIHGNYYIYEPNKIILAFEIALLSVYIILVIIRLIDTGIKARALCMGAKIKKK